MFSLLIFKYSLVSLDFIYFLYFLLLFFLRGFAFFYLFRRSTFLQLIFLCTILLFHFWFVFPNTLSNIIITDWMYGWMITINRLPLHAQLSLGTFDQLYRIESQHQLNLQNWKYFALPCFDTVSVSPGERAQQFVLS